MARFVTATLALLVISAISAISVSASDPELTSDFYVPPGVNSSSIDGSFFTFTGLKGGVPLPAAGKFGVLKVFSDAFPALTGLGVSTALLQFTPNGINAPHTHPRGTELLYVISGSLTVGLIDTTNKLFEQNITAGDLFVFPKGLVHYQINLDPTYNTTAIAAFSSSSPGLVSLPVTLFGSSIPTSILATGFGVSEDVIGQLEYPFGGV